MKKTITFICLILTVSFCEVYSQTDRSHTGFESMYLHKDVDLTYQEILQFKLS